MKAWVAATAAPPTHLVVNGDVCNWRMQDRPQRPIRGLKAVAEVIRCLTALTDHRRPKPDSLVSAPK
jgi:hypothetical protein